MNLAKHIIESYKKLNEGYYPSFNIRLSKDDLLKEENFEKVKDAVWDFTYTVLKQNTVEMEAAFSLESILAVRSNNEKGRYEKEIQKGIESLVTNTSTAFSASIKLNQKSVQDILSGKKIMHKASLKVKKQSGPERNTYKGIPVIGEFLADYSEFTQKKGFSGISNKVDDLGMRAMDSLYSREILLRLRLDGHRIMIEF